jgi:hypothetical protein
VLDEPVLAALVGVGAAPHERVANGVDELRDELRTLSTSGQNGVLEVSLDHRWARVLVTEGELLGAYSDAVRAVEPSLGELAALLGGEPPRLLWFSAEAAQTLTLPTESQSSGAGPSAVERQVIWIVSRFEGDWGRAREHGGLVEELQEALAAMLDSLQLLAAELEAAGTGGETLEEAVGRLASGASEPRALEQLDQRLSGLGPQRACAVLVELVGEALRRVVRACPEPQLAEFCRQTAVALESELRATLSARPDAQVSRSGAMPR